VKQGNTQDCLHHRFDSPNDRCTCAHTPEPWEAVLLQADGVVIRREGWELRTDDYDVACAIERGAPIRKEADARRIAACVNACAGIPTEALQAGALARVLVAAGDRVAFGHNGSCEYEKGPSYTCTCGHDALGEALEALGAKP
jgi:hypothetical protein